MLRFFIFIVVFSLGVAVGGWRDFFKGDTLIDSLFNVEARSSELHEEYAFMPNSDSTFERKLLCNEVLNTFDIEKQIQYIKSHSFSLSEEDRQTIELMRTHRQYLAKIIPGGNLKSFKASCIKNK
ncbi:hypothetical protein [Cellvibrio sp. NN19]|uniref:hypothetical protein n=1 Tax=Cellvibrio chitinivorans TaxID=3102792 RepID=UPI002B413DBA|nr:hypothetical protein [Cellvibrio sp. NN19]